MTIMLSERPQSVRRTLQYHTDIQRADTGAEHRVSSTAKPRVVLQLDYLLTGESIVSKQLELLNEMHEDIIIPRWDLGDPSITGTFKRLSQTEAIRYFPRNAAENSITAALVDNEDLPDPGAGHLPFIIAAGNLGVPFMPENPSVEGESWNRTFDQHAKFLDTTPAGKIEVTVTAPKANQIVSAVYYATSAAQRDFWHAFANYTRGRLNAFLLPSYRQEATFIRFGNARNALVVKDEHDIAERWRPGQRLRVVMPSGNAFFARTTRVQRITSSGRDTGQIVVELEHPLAGVELPDAIQFLDVARLNDDRIVSDHTDNLITYSLSFNLIPDDEPLVPLQRIHNYQFDRFHN